MKGSPRDRSGRHPFANEIGLLIEVADSSLNRDRTTKARLYARASIPVYWIVNLAEGRLEILSQPTGPSDEPAYQQTDVHGPDESAPLFLDGREAARVSVRDLLP